MRTRLTLLVPLVAVVLGAVPASSQTLRDDKGPAEYPPASYTGRQYVDSRGCVYVRAGVGSAVKWVPRVRRDKTLVCGQKPTFAAARPAEAPTPVPATAPPRSVRTAPKPKVAAVTAAPPRAVPRPAPTTTVTQQPAPGAAAASAPAPAQRSRPAGAAAPATACPNVSPEAQPYIRSRPGYPVRCGPQPEDPYGGLRRREGGLAPAAAPAAPAFAPPPGYRPAFKDDRLNPYRGRGTAEGAAQMARVWTNTVPRRLVAQNAAGEPAPALVVSTKAPDAPAAAPASAVGEHAYVQVGAFAVPANAQAAARRLQALGLPARIAQGRLARKPVKIVMAGPFASAGDLRQALARLRAAGFADAFRR